MFGVDAKAYLWMKTIIIRKHNTSEMTVTRYQILQLQYG